MPLLLLCLLVGHNLYAQSNACSLTIEGQQTRNLCVGKVELKSQNDFNADSWIWERRDNENAAWVSITGADGGSTYTVTTPGEYRVVASSSTDPSCGAITSNVITVQGDRPIQPLFTVSPTGEPCSGEELELFINSPEDNVNYIWNFGDNSAVGRGTTVTHTYTSTGIGTEEFTVKVFGTRSGCISDTVTQVIRVRQKPEISFEDEEENDFQVCLPDSVSPQDTTVYATIRNTTAQEFKDEIDVYWIDWGKGEPAEPYRPEAFPVKSPTPYDTLGNYTITMTAAGPNGCEVTTTQVFKYSQEPKANFSLDKKERAEEDQVPPCVPVIVTPTDSSTGGGLSYKWAIQPDKGYQLESGTLTSPDPVFRFTESGVYNVELIVENGCGSDTTSQSIVIGWPQVQVPASVTYCGPTTVEYSSSGAGGGGGIPGGGGGGPGGGSAGSIMVDKNLGENVTVTVTIKRGGATVSTQTFNSDTFSFEYDFNQPGTYTVGVEAVNECGSSNAIYQGQPAPVQEVVILQQPVAPTVQAPPTACAGETVRLAPSGGGPIYVWFDSDLPEATPIATGPSFTTPALTEDVTYYVAALDTANSVVCISPRTPIAIEVVPGVTNNTIEGEQVQTLCKGEVPPALTGSTPSGGDTSVPYSYSWQISTTGPSAGFAAAPGVNNEVNYTPTAPINSDTWFRRLVYSGSCSADTSNVVAILAVDPIPASANTVESDQEICEGDTPATLIGSRPTGGGGAPYTYMWEISTDGAEEGFTSAPGANNGENYTIPAGTLTEQETWFRRAVTSGGCTSYSEAVRVTVYPKLANNTISADEPDVCTGTTPGILTGSTPEGGSGSYTYVWERSTTGPNAGFTKAPGTSNGQSYSPGPLTRTTWFRRIVTSAACGADTSAALEIQVSPAVRNNTIVATQTAVCTGQVAAQITGSTPTDGAGGYTYLWESSTTGPNAGFVQAAGTNDGQNYTPAALQRDTWFRRVVFSGGCSDTSEVVNVTVLPIPASPSLVTRNATACENGSVTLAVANPTASDYRWYTSSTGGAPVFIGPEFTLDNVTQSATYYVEAVNEQECASAARTPATVTVVAVEAGAGKNVTIISGQTVELRGSGGVTYRWEPIDYLNNPNIKNPIAKPEKTTTYTVTVTTEEGCTDTASVTVEVIPAIKVPNAFTPNGDNVNEIWEIENYQTYPDMRVEVFNRWGNKVYSSKGYGVPWDGTHNGKELPVATYYYLIYLRSTDEEPISGNVTIIR
ncbi:gliding motility-associated-like protein [Pontibacter ummariensis]|uniref:Gliding motility-associated C-terminal domain-containing protein n=1 Tax=Pontibacter ummariensis TaxID=1610492 RepID=A0A239CQI9_9BACT|nr:gliding motility-associated C-terminal domain-containing protein [Pontibacter ummariensis]PRY14892.1 gliding motility-associated-like protein [Pontibacter ummariensis]SNS22179.1 gliding motility-associated C-terminal domain-containing protein [Pontibacter ummariensis]